MIEKTNFSVGHHRPVYLWGGPGTVRMNELKFMGAPNDLFVHEEAHTAIGADRMSQEAGFNWAYLMYNWGFPPEIEVSDWKDFEKAVPIYQKHGLKVFGYIQASNCVFDGSYKTKNWYALDPQGRKIFYYTGRYMTCWLNPDWIQQLRDRISGIIEAGGDGVFFDNPWNGAQPIHIAGTWSGFAGCYCTRCQKTFTRETGGIIPLDIHPEDNPASLIYLEWRADVVTRTIETLSAYARGINPDIVISANNYDAIMHPTYLSHGVDLPGLAKYQDIVMIEDFALPDFQEGVLVNNNITIRTAKALVGDTPITTNPYDRGIGFDDVYPPHRIQRGVAEAAACGTAMVVKGTEFVDSDGVFNLLTAAKYAPQRKAVGAINQWLVENSSLFQYRHNIARIALVYPEKGFKYKWDHTAEQFFGIGQTLTTNGFPWRVVSRKNNLTGFDLIFCFEKTNEKIKDSIFVSELPGWQIASNSPLEKSSKLRSLTTSLLTWFYRSYFKNHCTRWLFDALGLPQWFLGSPHFKIPPKNMQHPVLDLLARVSCPQVKGQIAPVLIEHYQGQEKKQVHLVNYGTEAQNTILKFPNNVDGIIKQFNHQDVNFSGNELSHQLDIYTIILYQET